MYEGCYLHEGLGRVYIPGPGSNTWVNPRGTLHRQHIGKPATLLFKIMFDEFYTLKIYKKVIIDVYHKIN